MENQVQLITEFLDNVGGDYATSKVQKYVKMNLDAKAKLNNILGLTIDNGLTKTLPIAMTNDMILSQYYSLTGMLGGILRANNYTNIDYVAGTCKNQKNQDVRLTRVLQKFKENIQEHDNYKHACRSLGITDYKFESLCPRLGELANSSTQELFITSSIAEFMRVNYHSSYSSCYKHQACGGTSYWTGTLSYGIDPFTLLVGIRNKENQCKTGRSWLWTFPDGVDSNGTDHGTPFMVQPKSYGEFTTLHRKAVREAIQDCIQQGKWKLSSGEENSVRQDNRYGYIDNYDLTIAYAKGESKPRQIYINFSENDDSLFCLECGSHEDLSDGSGLCSSCDNNYVGYCAECGDGIEDEDDLYYGSDDQCYCHSCYSDRFFYCECCSETAEQEGSEIVRGSRNGRRYTERVCEYCLSYSSNIGQCDDCSSYFFTDEISLSETVEGDQVCDDCSEGYCDHCELAFMSSSVSVKLADGREFCGDCAESETFVCLECGERFETSDAAEESDEMCQACYDAKDQPPLIADSEYIREAA